MNDPIQQNAYEQIEERRQRKVGGRLLLAILLPVALLFASGCIACIALATA